MMTTASDLYKSGKLHEAIDAQILEVKAKPADHGKRLFLFELFAFAGELDRARRQIEAVKYDDPDLGLAVIEYRQLLDSEAQRRKVFTEGIVPELLGNATSEHLVLRIEASNLLRQDRATDAATLLDEANDAVPPFRGTLNGQPFASLRDADDLFAGVLEVMVKGRYFWVPLEQVVSVATNPPRFPRDLLYMPARLGLGAETAEVYLPVLYPGSHLHTDDAIRLGRMTDWSSTEGGPVLGAGARLYITDDEPVSLVECRQYIQGTSLTPVGE
jgi:type VI secretion system protein ImpE